MDILLKKKYNLGRMLDKQRKIIYFYIKNNLFLDYDTEENIRILFSKV